MKKDVIYIAVLVCVALSCFVYVSILKGVYRSHVLGGIVSPTRQYLEMIQEDLLAGRHKEAEAKIERLGQSYVDMYSGDVLTNQSISELWLNEKRRRLKE